jgi:hypothetical protein
LAAGKRTGCAMFADLQSTGRIRPQSLSCYCRAIKFSDLSAAQDANQGLEEVAIARS